MSSHTRITSTYRRTSYNNSCWTGDDLLEEKIHSDVDYANEDRNDSVQLIKCGVTRDNLKREIYAMCFNLEGDFEK